MVQPSDTEPVTCQSRSCSQFLPFQLLFVVERIALYDLIDLLKSSLALDKLGRLDDALVMPKPRVVAGVEELKLTFSSSTLKPLM